MAPVHSMWLGLIHLLEIASSCFSWSSLHNRQLTILFRGHSEVFFPEEALLASQPDWLLSPAHSFPFQHGAHRCTLHLAGILSHVVFLPDLPQPNVSCPVSADRDSRFICILMGAFLAKSEKAIQLDSLTLNDNNRSSWPFGVESSRAICDSWASCDYTSGTRPSGLSAPPQPQSTEQSVTLRPQSSLKFLCKDAQCA